MERNTFYDRLIMVIPPEGTRKKTSSWKTGFYYVALGAGVPISMGFIDYKRKAVGFGPLFMPTGYIEADISVFREFYSTVTGKYPEKMSEVTVPPRTSREASTGD